MKKCFSKKGTIFFAVLFLLCSCSARTQDVYPADLVKSFAEAGLPLLKQKVSPRDFSLPAVLSAPVQSAAVKPPLAVPQGTTGKNLSLSALKGKVVFLNFWATWCGPCRAEMPSMEVLYGRYKEKGLEIFAVNCGEEQEQVLAFMKNNGLSFPAALDSDGKVSKSYGIQAIPTSFIIDREGKIIVRLVGSIDWDTPKIRTALERLLDSH